MFPRPAFHEGECAAQERVGVREKMNAIGQHVIRDFMPDQHRELFTRLPFVIVGTVDSQGQPWTSVLANPPGFIESPTSRELIIYARPLTADPLVDTLVPGAAIGLLGIEPHTRRRNRMNGVIQSITDNGFRVRVIQSSSPSGDSRPARRRGRSLSPSLKKRFFLITEGSVFLWKKSATPDANDFFTPSVSLMILLKPVGAIVIDLMVFPL